MKAQDRFRALVKGEKIDRIPMIEWATWWDETTDKWVKNHPNIAGLSNCELHKHFGLDISLQQWFKTITDEAPQPMAHGAPVISTMEEYNKYRHAFLPKASISDEFIRYANELHESGTGLVWFTLEGFFWFPRKLLGIEDHMYSFYDMPDFYHKICEDLLEWQLETLDYCSRKVEFDFMTLAEDMSYNNGPMISKEIFDEFLKPYYKKIVPELKGKNIITIVDSDGDITKAVDWFAECDVDGMLPLERQAGVDVSLYIESHPNLLFLGHYDKMIMHKGEEALRKEFERLLPSMVKGKFIPSVDHQTPPSVSYEDYQLYVKLLKEYCEKAAFIKNSK